ncbi:MAG TPA: hypothetical protein VNU01_05280, partial [Egibacteraceae bacterium]|nr:hypothetical protein [Egibacteraceae bacterium]
AVLCSGQGEYALGRALAVRTALLASRDGAVAAAERAVEEAGPRAGAETGIVVYDADADDVVARATRGTFPVLTRDRDGVRVVQVA